MSDNNKPAQGLYPMQEMPSATQAPSGGQTQPGTQPPDTQAPGTQAPGTQPPQYGGQGMQPPPGIQYGGQYGMQPPAGGQYVVPPVQYAQPGQPGQPPMMVQPGAPGATQPQSAQWMAMPQTRAVDCPPGLEYLTQLDQLLVHQQVELMEVFTGFEFKNRYILKNSMGQQVYYAHEESDGCQRQCCGNQRGFVMHIDDNMQQEVFRIVREFKCCAGWNCCACSDCCAMEVAVEAPVGTIVGYVRQTVSYCEQRFDIMDASRNVILKITGPCCFCQNACCTDDIEFDVHGKGETIGKLSKQWGGIFKEAYTSADNYTASFPIDLDVRVKALLIGAVFLFDFMFFGRRANQRR